MFFFLERLSIFKQYWIMDTGWGDQNKNSDEVKVV
jgi:hypothetical protein